MYLGMGENGNSSSQLTLVPPTPQNPLLEQLPPQLGYQSSTIDIIQSTNATLSPNQLNNKMLNTNQAATLNALNGARPGKAMHSRNNNGLEEDYEELLNSIAQDDGDTKETRVGQNTQMMTSQKRSSTDLLDDFGYGGKAAARSKVNDEPKIEFSSKKQEVNKQNLKNLNEDSDFDLDNY